MKHNITISMNMAVELLESIKEHIEYIQQDMAEGLLFDDGRSLNELEDLQIALRNKIDDPQEYYPVVELSRQGLEDAGYDVRELTDEQFQEVVNDVWTEDMADSFQFALDWACETNGVKKLEEDESE